jgi:hypothetical protein
MCEAKQGFVERTLYDMYNLLHEDVGKIFVASFSPVAQTTCSSGHIN